MGHSGVQALVKQVKLEWSPLALADLDRFAAFLEGKFPSLALRIGKTLIEKSEQLRDHPNLGQPVGGNTAYRQLTLHALRATYVLQYEIHPDRIVILRVFHGRESRG